MRRLAAAVAFCLAALLGSTLLSSGPASASMAQRRVTALQWAETQAGKPYIYGGTGPGGYDCSGLVETAWAHAGFSLPRTTYAMLASSHLVRVSASQRQRGDLVFWGNYHVEFVTRHATFGAQQSGTRIGWHPLWGSPTFWRVR